MTAVAAEGIAALNWTLIATYTLAGLFPAAIIGATTWLIRRAAKTREADRARQKRERDEAITAQIASTVTEKLATVEANVTQRITDSDAATEAQIRDLKAGQAQASAAIADLQLKIATETGGNSNGLRQELNLVSRTVAEIKGAFDQHIAENQN